MAYDPHLSARAKTPWGSFELKPSHLKTGSLHVPPPVEPLPEETLTAARLVVCDMSVDTDDARDLLTVLGLWP